MDADKLELENLMNLYNNPDEILSQLQAKQPIPPSTNKGFSDDFKRDITLIYTNKRAKDIINGLNKIEATIRYNKYGAYAEKQLKLKAILRAELDQLKQECHI